MEILQGYFSNTETAASITDVNHELIRLFKIILQNLVCSKVINGKNLESTQNKIAIIHNDKYSWRYIPSKIHKILQHGEK